MITGDQTGDVMFYGKGAGKNATASAVAADVIDCVKHLENRKYLFWEDGEKDYVDNSADEPTVLYVRLSSDSFSELEKQFEAAFPGVSCVKNKYRGDIAFLTEKQPESVTREKLKGITSAKSVKVLHTLGLRG